MLGAWKNPIDNAELLNALQTLEQLCFYNSFLGVGVGNKSMHIIENLPRKSNRIFHVKQRDPQLADRLVCLFRDQLDALFFFLIHVQLRPPLH